MPIPFSCPHCGRETLAEDKYAGETGPCIGCGKDVTVPLAVTQGAVVPDGKPAISGAAALSITLGCLLVVLMLLLLSVFGVGAFWMW